MIHYIIYDKLSLIICINNFLDMKFFGGFSTFKILQMSRKKTMHQFEDDNFLGHCNSSVSFYIHLTMTFTT